MRQMQTRATVRLLSVDLSVSGDDFVTGYTFVFALLVYYVIKNDQVHVCPLYVTNERSRAPRKIVGF